MSTVKAWVAAARLRTLPLSVSGIIVGASLGYGFVRETADAQLGEYISVSHTPLWKILMFWLAILTTVGFQVISNFANDYGDGVKGTDKDREGEQRMVASGVISPGQMRRGIILTSVITFGIALWLLYEAFGWEQLPYLVLFLVLGIASIAAAIKYTVGKNPYGYSGFGDLFVFLFFGLLSVLGTYFLFAKDIPRDLILPAITVGLFSVAVLNLNNMRDIANDARSGKKTIVVKLGSEKAKLYHYALLIIGMGSAIFYTVLHYESIYQWGYCVAFIPLILNMVTVARNKEPVKLDGELKKVALSTFLFAVLFAILH